MPPRPRPVSRLLLACLLAAWGAGGLFAQAAPPEPYPQPDPSGDEQLLLELMNRARADPSAEGVLLAGVQDRDILQSYAYFKVDAAALPAAFAGYAARPPLAMNARLMASARAHGLDLAVAGVQRHDGSDGSTFDGRITATGYDWSAVGENVYSWSLNPFFAHVGFNADWGVPALDHRANIMNLAPDVPTFREVGVSVVPARVRKDFGPFVVTQDFGTPADAGAAFLLGVVYTDGGHDNFYGRDEGLAGVTVTTDRGGYYAVTPAAGGFVLPLPTRGAGRLTVMASGGALGGPRVKTVAWTAGVNVKVDFTTADPVDDLPALAAADLPVVSLDAPSRGSLTGLVTISRTGGTEEALRVSLRYGGTAVNGLDYAGLSRRVEIPAGSASVDLVVQALSNEASAKRLVVAVQPGNGYAIGTGEIIRARARN